MLETLNSDLVRKRTFSNVSIASSGSTTREEPLAPDNHEHLEEIVEQSLEDTIPEQSASTQDKGSVPKIKRTITRAYSRQQGNKKGKKRA